MEAAWPQLLYPAGVLRDFYTGRDSSGTCEVEYLSEERGWIERVDPQRVYGETRGSGTDACRDGRTVWIDWSGTQWYAADVRGVPDAEGQCPIHYVDYADSWDENVSLERLRANARFTPTPKRDAQP